MITEEEIELFLESRPYVECYNLYIVGVEEGIRWALGKVNKTEESE